MFRTHDTTPTPPPAGAGEPAEAAQGVTPLPQFWWSWAGLVCSPLVLVWLVAARLPGVGLALSAFMLALAMFGTTPRRLVLGSVRAAVRLPWRAWPLVAGLAGAGWLWTEGKTLLSCAVGLLGAAPIFTAALGAGLRPSGERTHPVKPGADEEWRRRVEEKWPGTAGRAGLHRPDEASAVPVLVQSPRLVGRGAVAMRINLEPAERAPEDVHAAVPTLIRGLRARYADVRAVDPHGVDLVDLTLWRGRHPLDEAVSYRDMRPVRPGHGGEWVPVGRLATGGTAVLRWRFGTFISGAPETGKTCTQVAMLYGMRLQGVPLGGGLHIIDTLGDLRAWQAVLGERYAGTMTAALPLAERFATAVQDRYDQLGHGEEVIPDRDRPAMILIITEGMHLRQARAGFTKQNVTDLDTALQYVGGSGRRAAASLWIARQLPQKDTGDGGVGALRDLLRQRVGHWVPDESMVDPAMGSGALQQGARLHDLPESLKGAAYIWDRQARFPVMMRPALIPPADRARVFGLRAA